MPAINRLVDIGNIISLRHLVPASGHAIELINGDLSLCKAKGDEVFNPFGTDQIADPLPGEIFFTEGKTVPMRCGTWRQANHTVFKESTKAVEFNVDGLSPTGNNDV